MTTLPASSGTSTAGSASRSRSGRGDGRRRIVRGLRHRPRPRPVGAAAGAAATRSSSTAHDVLREFRILDAIKDEPVPIARPILCVRRPRRVRLALLPDGAHRRRADPQPRPRGVGGACPSSTVGRSSSSSTRSSAIHAVDWRSVRPGEPRATRREYLAAPDRPAGSASSTPTAGRDLPAAHRIGAWLDAHRPADQQPALCHGDYKLDNVLFAPDAPPRAARRRRLGDGVDRRPAGRPRLGAHLPPRAGRHHAARRVG